MQNRKGVVIRAQARDKREIRLYLIFIRLCVPTCRFPSVILVNVVACILQCCNGGCGIFCRCPLAGNVPRQRWRHPSLRHLSCAPCLVFIAESKDDLFDVQSAWTKEHNALVAMSKVIAADCEQAVEEMTPDLVFIDMVDPTEICEKASAAVLGAQVAQLMDDPLASAATPTPPAPTTPVRKEEKKNREKSRSRSLPNK